MKLHKQSLTDINITGPLLPRFVCPLNPFSALSFFLASTSQFLEKGELKAGLICIIYISPLSLAKCRFLSLIGWMKQRSGKPPRKRKDSIIKILTSSKKNKFSVVQLLPSYKGDLAISRNIFIQWRLNKYPLL